MKDLYIGQRFQIQCYKHNGKPHRCWDEAILVDVHKDYLVFANNKTTVIESGGNTWKTKEPAIMYFFKNEWYNIITQLKKEGTTYYCNIATPFIIEEESIKYIDYDLDLRVFPNGSYKVLDKMEYQYHKRIMNYSDDLDSVINHAMTELIEAYNTNKENVFDEKRNKKYYEIYNECLANYKKIN